MGGGREGEKDDQKHRSTKSDILTISPLADNLWRYRLQLVIAAPVCVAVLVWVEQAMVLLACTFRSPAANVQMAGANVQGCLHRAHADRGMQPRGAPPNPIQPVSCSRSDNARKHGNSLLFSRGGGV